MTIGSLFSGIGGLELGLEWTGLGPTVWQVEQNEFCRAVLAKHWPDADRSVCDVKQAGAVLPRVDVLCGGPPCQPASMAGKRRGAADERWLWGETIRIVGELRPTCFVFENPVGLATLDRSRAFTQIVHSLAAHGYDVGWIRMLASDVGAPHRRERIFILGVANTGRQPVQRRADDGGVVGAARQGTPEGVQRQRGRDAACDGGAVLADSEQTRRCNQRRKLHGTGSRGTGTTQEVQQPEPGGLAEASCQRSQLAHTEPRRLARGDFDQDAGAARSHRGRSEGQQPEPGGPAEATFGRRELGNPNSPGLQLDGQQEQAGEQGEPRGLADGPDGAGHQLRDDQERYPWDDPDDSPEPRMGDAAHGVPRWMAGRWPSRQGEAQADWEAPRTCEKFKGRADQLKALGNAVVPQCAYAVGLIVRQLLGGDL